MAHAMGSLKPGSAELSCIREGWLHLLQNEREYGPAEDQVKEPAEQITGIKTNVGKIV